ncbi:EAL domain-containing protein [Caballeronia calidae]|uniref:EAL domain-containing protein n=1 Tax=Caballeronia calidae TaxID=1777139 RepID=UPI000B339042|nr:EAL domain-containing protein [Caballeronia calidae]
MGRIYGAEALLRWNHPQLGLLTPADFLNVLLESPAYEATGLSPTTIQNCDLAALVSEGALASGVCASVLDIEVTETAVMSDFAAASRALSAVRRLDVTVSLDDFGTGYSSLAYLMRLPVDRVKIDKSFVQELTAKETCRQARDDGRSDGGASARVGHANGRGRHRDGNATWSRQGARVRCRARLLHWQAGVGSAHRTFRGDAVLTGVGCGFAISQRKKQVALAVNA